MGFLKNMNFMIKKNLLQNMILLRLRWIIKKYGLYIHKKKLPILNLHHPVLSFTCTLLSAWIAYSWIEFFTYYVCISWFVVGATARNDKWSEIIWVKCPLNNKYIYSLPTFKCVEYSKKTIIVDINTLSLFAASPAIKLNWN